MKIIYHLFILLYFYSAKLVGFFNKKAALFYKGRVNLFSKIESEISQIKPKGHKVIWIHSASVGEFEQARPIIENLRSSYSNIVIIVTFFSPSGYELRKNYNLADAVFYLPMDTYSNAKRFIHLISPDIAIFIKYEFWLNYLTVLKSNNIPTYVVSAIFRESQPFFKWWGGWYRSLLNKFDTIFVQDAHSKELLSAINYANVVICGDTRFDRVHKITNTDVEIKPIKDFVGESFCVVAGSTWSMDESLIYDGLSSDISQDRFKFIIASHEVGEARITEIISRFNLEYVRFSEIPDDYSKEKYPNIYNKIFNSKIFIIDTIGILSVAYRYGDIAYIGGGFGAGIHNILEAATYGLPVIFGPKYHKFNEAINLVNLNGAFSVDSSNALKVIVQKLINDKEFYNNSSKSCLDYVSKNIGATDIVVKSIKEIVG